MSEPGSPEYLRQSVEIAPDLLDEEFVQLSATVAFWNAQFAEACRARDFASLLVKQVKAKAEQKIRNLVTVANEAIVAVTDNATPDPKTKGKPAAPVAKLTEAAVAAAVTLDAEVIEAEHHAINTDYEVNRLKGIVDAIRTKRDMVIQLGATRRLEMEGDPIVRKRMADRRSFSEG